MAMQTLAAAKVNSHPLLQAAFQTDSPAAAPHLPAVYLPFVDLHSTELGAELLS